MYVDSQEEARTANVGMNSLDGLRLGTDKGDSFGMDGAAFPSSITRECPLSLLALQGNTHFPF